MTNVLILVVILMLLFSTEKFKELGRIALAFIIGAGIIGKILNYPLCVEMFTITNFLLLAVIYILLFGADRFKEKSKIAILVILGAVVIFCVITINIPKNIVEENWKDILIGILVVFGSFIVAYMLNKLRKK